MKKSNLLLVVLLVLALALAGCTSKSGIAVGEVSSSTGNSISSKYESSSQTITKEFTLKDGETATFSIGVVTESGEISIDIVDSNGNSIYSEKEIQTSTTEAKADTSGKYTLKVITKEHKGGFDITFDINK